MLLRGIGFALLTAVGCFEQAIDVGRLQEVAESQAADASFMDSALVAVESRFSRGNSAGLGGSAGGRAGIAHSSLANSEVRWPFPHDFPAGAAIFLRGETPLPLIVASTCLRCLNPNLKS